MYAYVEKNCLKDAKNLCVKLLNSLEIVLRKEGNINTQFFLVGSGANNMVTRNDEGPIDFDYNLKIISSKEINNCREIKETVRKAFNKVLNDNEIGDCDDSTSSLTTKQIFFRKKPDIKFSIDLCIVATDEENKLYRLKHEKTGYSEKDKYYWNEAPMSDNIKEKVAIIKEANMWLDVRKKYLAKKNMYLTKNDFDHPSFICYIEAVNEVYNTL